MLAFRTNHIPTMLEEFGNMFDTSAPQGGELRPSVDIFDEGERFIVVAELPGVEEKEIDIEFAQNVLSIKAERKFIKDKEGNYHRREITNGTYSRNMKFSTGVDATRIEASYKNGLLEISLPKEEKLKPRKIKIASA